MAWTGAAAVQNLGSVKARITGLSLAAGASGTIGLNGDAGADVQLPASFPAVPNGTGLAMADVVRAVAKPAGAPAGTAPAAAPAMTSSAEANPDAAAAAGANPTKAEYDVAVTLLNSLKAKFNQLVTDAGAIKTAHDNAAGWGGFSFVEVTKGGAPFRLTFTNRGAVATPALEIEVDYQHTATR